jgi:Flp pilus assembly protein TadG
LHGETGTSAVEFALVLPLFIVLIFGILHGGITMNRLLSLNQGAREGARLGATYDFEGDPDTWYEAVRSRIVAAAAGELGPGADICIRFVRDGALVPPSGAPGGFRTDCSVPAAAGLGSDPRVEVLVSRPGRFEFVFYGWDVVLVRDAVARYEGG